MQEKQDDHELAQVKHNEFVRERERETYRVMSKKKKQWDLVN